MKKIKSISFTSFMVEDSWFTSSDNILYTITLGMNFKFRNGIKYYCHNIERVKEFGQYLHKCHFAVGSPIYVEGAKNIEYFEDEIASNAEISNPNAQMKITIIIDDKVGIDKLNGIAEKIAKGIHNEHDVTVVICEPNDYLPKVNAPQANPLLLDKLITSEHPLLTNLAPPNLTTICNHDYLPSSRNKRRDTLRKLKKNKRK